jgi:heptosyltransferase-2
MGPGTHFLKDAKGPFRRALLPLSLRRHGLRTAVLFQNAFAAAVLGLAAKERVGYARDLRGPLLTHPVPPERNILASHEVFYHLNLLSRLDGPPPAFSFPWIPDQPDRPDRPGQTGQPDRPGQTESPGAQGGPGGPANPIPPAAPRPLLDFLRGSGEGRFVLAAAPGAAFGGAKRAPLDLFSESIRLIMAERPKGLVAILGGKAEMADAKSLAGSLGGLPGVFDLSGLTTLPQALGILKRASLLLSNDSGLMHLGGAAGARVLAFFGPTDPLRTGPAAPASAVLRVPGACPLAPCRERECRLARRACFDGLAARDVLEAAASLLRGPLPGGAGRGGAGVILAMGDPGPGPTPAPGRVPGSGPVHAPGGGSGPFRPLPGADPQDPRSYAALAESEGLDLARSVFVGDDPASLRAATGAFGGHTVLLIRDRAPEGILQGPFLPKIAAPSLEFALSYALALLAWQEGEGGKAKA